MLNTVEFLMYRENLSLIIILFSNSEQALKVVATELATPVNCLETMAGVAKIGLVESTITEGVEITTKATE